MIGDDHLLPKCVEILLERGHTILGIISPLAESQKLATQHHIDYFGSLSSAQLTLSTTSFDYLFSIVNSSILTEKIISSAKKLAINFHNAPLPRYAGVHAPSWAILNDEKNHGVTWHLMTNCIDGGDILKQAIFSIDPHETGLSLNLKCYQYAVTTFKELINDIERKAIAPISQNSNQRSYYNFNQKPLGNGWISWDNSAESIERVVRALDLGHHHHNRLAAPKLKLGNNTFIISKLQQIEELSNEPPGTIVKILSGSWYIATQTTMIRIDQLHSLDGRSCTLDTIALDYNLYNGYQLPSPTLPQLTQYERFSSDCARWEPFWVRELITINHSALPFLSPHQHHNECDEINCLGHLSLSKKIFDGETWISPDTHPIDILLTGLFIYLYRMESNDQMGIGFGVSTTQQEEQTFQEFFTPLVPFSITFESQLTFYEALQLVKKQRAIIEGRLTFAKDVFYRYPELLQTDRAEYHIAVIIDNKATLNKTINHIKAPLIITIASDSNELTWWSRKSLISQEGPLVNIIQNSIGHLQTLLESLPDNKDSSISKLPLLTHKELQAILHNLSKTALTPSGNKTIVEAFENQVCATPNNVALIYEYESLTYNELNKKANQLARYLQKKGLSANTFGAICTTQEVHLIIGILAILKTGAAYIPIDRNYPTQHIRFLLSDSKPKILLASIKPEATVQDDCTKQNTSILLFQTIAPFISNEDENNLQHIQITPETLAYVIYTSGTTGKPKGVMVPHRGVVRLVNNTNYIQIHTHDRMAQAASVSFDAATFEIWGALLNGATLIAIPHSTLLNISKFSEFLDKNAITILWLTSALFNQYAEKNPGLFKQLTYLLVGGDVLNKERIMSVLDCTDGSPHYILNGYGPTENTTFTTTHLISQQDKHLSTIPIGKPITNTSVYILDEYLQPVPLGAVGELYSGGEGLALGYLNRPELTKEKFIDNPFGNTKEAKLYKTGDMVRWMPNATIEYLGRRDSQIKIRGFRVEPSAIQAHLLHHQAISQCVVTAHELDMQTKVLVAYIVCTEEISDKEIQSFLAHELPSYMIPNFFMRLNELPLTTNGKINHNKLPPIDYSKSIRTSDYVAPETTLEKSLTTLWSKLLATKNISVDDNFFDLGGHSLLITQLILQIKDKYQIDLSLHKFLYNPTVRHLGNLIENNNNLASISSENHNLLTDRIFPKDIRVNGLKHSETTPKFILLTGASGFLGAHLLHALYHATTAKIYCLVRETHDLSATSRINSNLAKYQFNLTCDERIIPLAGDLSLPKLGLSNTQFSDLTNQIDMIYHNGAAVHHLYNYDLLRTANVCSTLELIRLASKNKIKSIHYISTLSAASMHLNAENCIIEDFIHTNTAQHYPLDGYSQSKWVSEQLLAEASHQGIPLKIYRPGWIMGQSHSGTIEAENNHLLMLIKGCIQLGVAPNWHVTLDILPVDIISQLITCISLDVKNSSNVFNIVNPNTISWIDLISYLNNRGYDIRLIDPIIWKEKHLMSIDPENALYALYALYVNAQESDWMKDLSNICRANSHNTENALNTYQLTAPEIDKNLLNTYFDYLEQNNFITNHRAL